jgi:hypothetical protein
MPTDRVLLTVSHHIYLTKEERKALHDGETVETIGVSVPVLAYTSISTEPAKEVFCRYVISSPPQDVALQAGEDGYTVSVPRRKWAPRISEATDWEWRNMTNDQLLEYYQLRGEPISTHNVLDIEEGGSGGLYYREYGTRMLKGQLFEVVHHVHFEHVEMLWETAEI